MPDANGNQTNTQQYAYLNPGPGAVAAGSNAVGQATEASHYDLNPAFRPSVDTQGVQAGLGIQDPESAEPAGATDTANPVVGQDQRDQGPPQ